MCGYVLPSLLQRSHGSNCTSVVGAEDRAERRMMGSQPGVHGLMRVINPERTFQDQRGIIDDPRFFQCRAIAIQALLQGTSPLLYRLVHMQDMAVSMLKQMASREQTAGEVVRQKGINWQVALFRVNQS